MEEQTKKEGGRRWGWKKEREEEDQIDANILQIPYVGQVLVKLLYWFLWLMSF